MEWALILALGVWVWLQSRRIERLSRRLDLLEGRRTGAAPAFAPDLEPSESEFEPPRAANEEAPLELDAPLPPASNDEFANTPAPAPAPPATITQLRPLAAAPQRARRFEQWLAQNGLAWIGGGALALGGVFLVAVAAQSDFFTPERRLSAAVALGLALIAGSAWVRRAALKRRGGHPLVAALLAGAGAATLYVAAWAAHGLYHYVDAIAAATLMMLCALLLVALSQMHGQALGVLAIAAALLAPALTGPSTWPDPALTLYLCAVGASGALLAALRRWPWTAAFALLGLYVWFAAAIADDRIVRALALLATASLTGAAAALRSAGGAEPKALLNWEQARALAPVIAICVSSVLGVWTWLSVAPVATATPAGPALIAILHVALATLAVRTRAAAPAAFAVAVAALVVGFALFARARAYFAPGADVLYLWPLAAGASVGLAALGARPPRRGRVLISASGASGAALLVILAVFSRFDFTAPAVWAPLLLGACALIAASMLIARRVADPERDWTVNTWVCASAALALIGVESFAPTAARPAAHAALSFAFAWLIAWRGWRGASYAALAAAALALTHAMAPDFAGAVMAGELALWRALLFIAAAAAFLFGAADIAARRSSAKATGEALSSGAIAAILLGFFLALRWAASGGVAIVIDSFTENALRALVLLAAGYITLPRRDTLGQIARMRGHVLVALGLGLALASAALVFNPWWGQAPAAISGPPVLNAQALAFAAPAAFAFAAARLLYAGQLFAPRLYAAVGALLAALWAVMEIRRSFHGADMGPAETGLLEGGCYGLLALISALALAFFARRRALVQAERPFTRDLAISSRALAIAAFTAAALLFVFVRNPWWGGQNPALSTDLATGLASFCVGIGAALSLLLGRVLSEGATLDVTRFIAAATATVLALVFGHDALRWMYHRGAMDDAIALFVGLEGFGHALWPLALVVGAAHLIARTPRTGAPAPLQYDLQALCGALAWPALAWTAIGLWLVFNPWWGRAPAFAATNLEALLGLTTLLLAAALSAAAPNIAGLRFKPAFACAATLAAAGHVFVAASLLVRRLFHGADMRAVLPGSNLETWTYSALWALFGAGFVALGSRRRDASLRWAGLALLLLVTGKVFLFDMATLNGVVRAASFLGLGLVLVLVALASRRFGAQDSRE